MNGLTLLALIALVVGVLVAYRAGTLRGRRDARPDAPLAPAVSLATATPSPAAPLPASAPEPAARAADLDAERARLIRSYESESASLRRELGTAAAERGQLTAFAEDRRALLRSLAEARGETARYRQLVVDIEENAPPPLLDGPGAPDDLKLIVGVGPVLERMLHQLGVGSYRQIARWSEREIDDFDARLAEFPGRIRRDGWVTQARALHASKYGETLPARDRG
jgi:predicted flap endonuclease-1-like 5' DNA nuclease